MRHVAFVTVLALAAGANAQIIGGSNLINNSDLNTLAGWLGQGPLKITNIFDHQPGDGKDSFAFHAAADGKGATFSIVRDAQTGAIYGGYNSNSWNSYEGWHFNAGNESSFLFNLTNNKMFPLNTNSPNGDPSGTFVSYNSNNYGPTFGGGHDLYLDQSLDSSYTYGYSYGDSENIQTGNLYDYHPNSLSDLEVFTIAVPAPGAGALLGIGGLMAARRRRA